MAEFSTPLLLFLGRAHLKGSSNVMGRSSLVHTSLTRNALSGAPHKFLFLPIPHLSMPFSDLVDGLEPGFKPPDFSPSISAILLVTKFMALGRVKSNLEQQLLITVILV